MRYRRLLLFSKFDMAGLRKTLQEHGFSVVQSKPDAIICCGGDGTLLLAESRHPGVPKLLVRRSNRGNKAYALTQKRLVSLLKQDRLRATREMKLHAMIIKGKKRITLPAALNDVVVRNANQVHALRFHVKANGIVYNDLIGDGIVVATPFGATGYFLSITQQRFIKGIGVALNNTRKWINPLVLPEQATIEICIDREQAFVSADMHTPVLLQPGDSIVVQKHSSSALLLRPAPRTRRV